MSAPHNPPRTGEGDHAQRGGGASPSPPRSVVQRARALRKAMTMPERLLWRALRQRPNGLKFRRQHPVGPYVVDFCCLTSRLAIEIDGVAHDMAGRAARDGIRARFLQENGYTVLRVSARRVLADVTGTAEAIVARVASGDAARGGNPLHRPADGPPPRAGED